MAQYTSYQTATVNGFKWEHWLSSLANGCYGIVRKYIGHWNWPNSSFRGHISRYITHTLKRFDEWKVKLGGDFQKCDTLLDLCYIICIISDMLCKFNIEESQDMFKHVQNQNFQMIRNLMKHAMPNVRRWTKRSNSAHLRFGYHVMNQSLQAMNYLADFCDTSLQNLARRFICQDLWMPEQIKHLPDTKIPTMLKKYLLSYWENVPCDYDVTYDPISIKNVSFDRLSCRTCCYFYDDQMPTSCLSSLHDRISAHALVDMSKYHTKW